MTTVVHIAGYGAASLRDRIVNDQRLEIYELEVAKKKTVGRNPGWAKLYGADYETTGAINLEWNITSAMGRLYEKANS